MEDSELHHRPSEPIATADAAGGRRGPPLAVRVVLFFLTFLLMTRVGYLFAFPPYEGIGVFWPSTGLCLAVLLLEPPRAWPAYTFAVFVGEFVGVALQGLPLPVCLVWSVVASGEPLLSAFLLRPGGAPFKLGGLRDLTALVGLGAVVSPAVAAMLAASAAVVWTDSPSWGMSWLTWWFGDAVGVLVVAPLLVVWLGGKHLRHTRRERLVGAAVVVAMVIATESMFGGPPGAAALRLVPGFLTFPILLWMALRFELRGVTVVAAIFNVLAAYHTTRGRGLFAAIEGPPLARLVTLQAYMSFGTLSALALAAALMERRRTERQRQDIIDNSTAVIFAKGIDHRYLFVNREFERITGKPRAEIVGRAARDLWPVRFAEHVERADAEVVRRRRALSFEDVVPTPGGERTFLSVRFPLADEDGVPYAVGGMSADITDRKRAEEALRRSEERLSLVVAATHDAIYDLDLQTCVVWRNDRLKEVFGDFQSHAEWVTRLHPDDRGPVIASLAAAKAAHDSTWRAEYRFARADGTYAHVLDNAYLLYDAAGRPTRILGALADITERRLAQEEIRQANVELEHRVERRTAELAVAYDEMEAFSYSISHDLRGPLRAINGFGSVLLEDHAKTLDAEGVEFLARIRAASRRMGQLIDDLLSLSRAGRAEVRHEDVDIGEMARSILSELREAEPARAVTAVIEEGLAVRGDPGLLRIVLQNLLANAWKFTSQHPHARIEVGRTRVGDEDAYYVRDDGAGFDIRYAGKLFRPFERLHRTNEFPGTGIGLATIHRIVGRHGGRVWATGEVEGGATFYFTLPRADAP